MITRATRHTLKYANAGKRDALFTLLAEWRRVMRLMCEDMWTNGYTWTANGETNEFNVSKYKFNLPKYLDYRHFNIDTWLSARMLSSLVTQLSGKLRAILAKEQARVYIFDTQAGNGVVNSSLWARIENSVPTCPDMSDAGIEISSKCADFIDTPSGKFYGYLRLKSTGIPHIKIPVCRHSHMKQYLGDGWTRCSGFLIDEYGVQIRLQKEIPNVSDGIRVGCDQGLKTVLSLSDGQTTPDMVITAPKKGDIGRKLIINLDTITNKIARKKKGSKAFKRSQDERKNYINYAIKRIDLSGIKEIALEDVENINYRRNTSRKMKAWSNPIIRDRLAMTAEEHGVRVTMQSSSYRSQRCSSCGLVRKASMDSWIFRFNYRRRIRKDPS